MFVLYVPWWAFTAWIVFLLLAYVTGMVVMYFVMKPDQEVPMQTKSTRGRAIAEQRRSNAAGKHGKHAKDRRNTKRRAIDQSRRDHEG